MACIMSAAAFAVMGAGHAGFGLAADLALRGFETRLYEFPEFAPALAPVQHSRQIKIRGVRGEGTAELAMT
ncbi:MAG: hypothetical protein WD535_01370, partial [Thermaerobacterales bacterium]